MERGSPLCFLLLLSLAPLMVGTARGYDFYVGGRSGWVANPSESYNAWSGRMRFSVNDSLVFVYDNSIDSVLQVTSADHSTCNAATPIAKLNTGRDSFKLTRSGPFYFITGNTSHCQAGQKLLVVVLAIRSPPSSPTPPAPGSTSSTPPATPPAPGSTASPATAPAPATTTTPAAPGSAPASAPSSPAPGSSRSLAPSSAPPTAPSSATTGSPPSESAPGSTATPGSGGSGSAGSPPRSSTATSLSVPAILALALLGGAIIQ